MNLHSLNKEVGDLEATYSMIDTIICISHLSAHKKKKSPKPKMQCRSRPRIEARNDTIGFVDIGGPLLLLSFLSSPLGYGRYSLPSCTF
jgi:hypothetical protein